MSLVKFADHFHCYSNFRTLEEKLKILRDWHHSGKSGYSKAGCLLVGYEAFRSLALFQESKKRRASLTDEQMKSVRNRVEETLLKPGITS